MELQDPVPVDQSPDETSSQPRPVETEASPKELCSAIEEKLDRLILMFTEKIQYDDQKEKAFSKLYDELDSFKRDFVERRMKEAYIDLILLYDNIENYSEDDDVVNEEGALARRYLGYVMEELTEVLARRGIEPICSSSSQFNPEFQRAIRTAPADCPARDGHVVRVVKDGFTKDGKVFRPQSVVVARWTAPAKPAESSMPAQSGEPAEPARGPGQAGGDA